MIIGIVILDSAGIKIVKKYFTPELKNQNEQSKLEAALYRRTKTSFNKVDGSIV